MKRLSFLLLFIGLAVPAFSAQNVLGDLNVNGAIQAAVGVRIKGRTTPPPLSRPGFITLYLDNTTHKLYASINGGAYSLFPDPATGSGTIGGSGTATKLPLFAAGTTLTDSALSQTGLNLQAAGDLAVTGLLKAGSGPITLTDTAGKLITSAFNNYADPAFITSLAGSKITGNIPGNAANVTGTVAVATGGTGATDAATARSNLGLAIGTNVPGLTGSGASGTWGISVTGNAGTVTNGVVTTGAYADPAWITAIGGGKISGDISGNAAGLSATLPVNKGGTGITAPTDNRILIGNGTGYDQAVIGSGLNWDGTTLTGTGAGGVGGSGTINKIPLYSGTSTLTDSVFSQSANVASVAQGGSSAQRVQTEVVVNAKDYGAIPDGRNLRGLVATAAGTSVTVPSGTFAPGTTGHNITLIGADTIALTDLTQTNGNATITSTSSHFLDADLGAHFILTTGKTGGLPLDVVITRVNSDKSIQISALVTGTTTTGTATGTLYRDHTTTFSYADSTHITLASATDLTAGTYNARTWKTDNLTPLTNAVNAALTSGRPAVLKLANGIYHSSAPLTFTGLADGQALTVQGEKGTVIDFTGATAPSPGFGLMDFEGSTTLLGSTTTSLASDANPGDQTISVGLTNASDLKPGDLIQITNYDKVQLLYGGGAGATISGGGSVTSFTVTLVGKPATWQTVVGAASPALGATGLKDDGSSIPLGCFITAVNTAGTNEILTVSTPLDAQGNPITCTVTNGTAKVYASDGDTLFARTRPEYNQGEFAEVERVAGSSSPFTVYLRGHLEGIYKASSASTYNSSVVYRVNAPCVLLRDFTIQHDDAYNPGSGLIGILTKYCRNYEYSGLCASGSFDRVYYPQYCFNGKFDNCMSGTKQGDTSSIYGLFVGSCQHLTVCNSYLNAARRGIDMGGWQPSRFITISGSTIGNSGFSDGFSTNNGCAGFNLHSNIEHIQIVNNRIIDGIQFETTPDVLIANNIITAQNASAIKLFCMGAQSGMVNDQNRNDLIIRGNHITAFNGMPGSALSNWGIAFQPQQAFLDKLGTVTIEGNQIRSEAQGIFFLPSVAGAMGVQTVGVYFDTISLINNDVVSGSVNGALSNAAIWGQNTANAVAITAPLFIVKHFEISGGKYETWGADSRCAGIPVKVFDFSGALTVRGVRFVDHGSGNSRVVSILGFRQQSYTDCEILHLGTVSGIIGVEAQVGSSLPNEQGTGFSADTGVLTCKVEFRGNRVVGATTANGSALTVLQPVASSPIGGVSANTATAGDILYRDNQIGGVLTPVVAPASGWRVISEYTNMGTTPTVISYGTAAPTQGTWHTGDRVYNSAATGGSGNASYWVYNGTAWIQINT